MDATFSKLDTDIIQVIESNVVDLLIRLREEEIYMDNFIKIHILKALKTYTEQIDTATRTGLISRHKSFKTKDLIIRTTNKLEDMKTLEHGIDNTHSEKDVEEVKKELFEIRKKLASQQIQSHECDHILKCVRIYAKKLEYIHNTMILEEENCISVLVLKLYLKSPVVKISDILQRNLDSLGGIVENFKLLNWGNISLTETQKAELKLQEFRSMLDDLDLASIGKQANTDFLNDSLVFKKLTDDLNEYEFLTNKMGSLSGENTLTVIRNNILFLKQNYLDEPSEKIEAEVMKRFILIKSTRILNKLKRITNLNDEVYQALRTLEEIENKALSLISSDECFASKKCGLENLQMQVNDLEIRSNEFRIQKVAMLNKIEGFIALEATRVLRQMKEFIDTFKVYSQQFNFPKNVNVYEFREKELYDLVPFLNEMPNGFHFINSRVDLMMDKIKETSKILERKAIDNQILFSTLDQLDHVKTKVRFIESLPNTPLSKLKDLNKIRKRVQIIDNFDNKIMTKKIEVCFEFHEVEEKIYSSMGLEKLQEIKVFLNGYEKKVQEFSGEFVHKDYQKFRDDLISVLNNIDKVINDEQECLEVGMVLKETTSAILNLLDKVSTENKDMNERLQTLDCIEKNTVALAYDDLTSDQIKKTLEEYEEILQTIKSSSKDVATLHKISSTERHITIEKSKLKIHHINNQLQILNENLDKLNFPMRLPTLKEHLNSVLQFKETIEDMPGGNSELDSDKTVLMQEVSATLQRLDKNFTKNLTSKTAGINFEMKNHFDGFEEEECVMDDSFEFIEGIRRRANNFESCVGHYLGTEKSIDYHAIREDLEELLNKLQSLECEDEELSKKVEKTQDYINGLINELELNAKFI